MKTTMEKTPVTESSGPVADEVTLSHEQRDAPPSHSAASEAGIEAEGERDDADSEAAHVARLIAEAEDRGYLRGRNERAEELMQKPAMFRSVAQPQGAASDAADEDTMILRQLRRSVWE